MKAATALVGLSLAACGCAALGTAGPATFREPAAKMAEALGRTAARPSFHAAVAAEALRDVRIAGRRALLDYRGESGGPRTLDAQSTCGPLELREVAQNKLVWSVERAASCDDEILAVVPRLAILGLREEAGKAGLYLSTLALDTGAVVAKLPLEKGAFAVPSGDALVVVEGAAGAQRVSLHDGETLETKWKLALDDADVVTEVLTLSGTVLVFGGSVTAIDRASGKRLQSTSLGTNAFALDVLATADAAYAMVVRDDAKTAIARMGADGSVTWTTDTTGILDAVTASAAFTVDGSAVTALRASDGSVAWTGKLPGVATGGGLVVQHGTGTLLLVPHADGVTAFDVTSGAVRFSVSPFGPDGGEAHATDRLSVASPDLVVLDTARGVAGLDLASEGRARYAIAVRSLPHAHRRGRLQAAYGKYDVAALLASARATMSVGAASTATVAGLSNLTGGGLAMGTAQMSMATSSYVLSTLVIGFAEMSTAMNARRVQQATVALRQARLDEESPLLLRPISWSTGRGLLVIRKVDGAFHEVVTGPPDVYEDPFRPASVAAFVPLASTVLTFSEGLDTSKWQDSMERAPVKLVARSLLGYALDDPSFHPAQEYEQRSVVPRSDFGALPGGPADAGRAPPAEAAPPPSLAATAQPQRAAPPPVPATASCRTRFDCKGGLICPRGQCIPPACVADRECATGHFCSLEGACEPLKRK